MGNRPPGHRPVPGVRRRGRARGGRRRQRPAVRPALRGARDRAARGVGHQPGSRHAPRGGPGGPRPGIAEWHRDDLVAAMLAADVPGGPVHSVGEAAAAMRSVEPDWITTVGGVQLTASPILVDGERLPIRRPPPRLGEHTDEILGEVGRVTLPPPRGWPAAPADSAGHRLAAPTDRPGPRPTGPWPPSPAAGWSSS